MLGRAIRTLREQRGLDLGELADTTGIDATRLDALEHGKLDPDLELLRKLAEAMSLRPSAFFLQAEQMGRPDDETNAM
jgi:transcriptional regulator with XRE-family HTH domain